MRFTSGTLMVGILAILFALGGAYALRASLVTKPAPVAAGPRTINVPLASNNLPVGRKIVLSDMALMPMTFEQAKERNLPLDTLMLSTDQIIGRVLREEIPLGKPFLTTSLFPEGEGPQLSTKLAPGFRAFTIPMDELNAVGGSVVDGQFVDIMFRLPAQVGDAFRRIPAIAETTVTLLENIEVIKINREAVVSRGPSGMDVRNTNRAPTPVVVGPIKSVTVAVTPDQANILKAAMGRGDIALRLRNGVDVDGKGTLGPVTLEKLIGVTATEAANLLPGMVQIYRGTGLQTMTYGRDNYFFGTGYGLGTTDLAYAGQGAGYGAGYGAGVGSGAYSANLGGYGPYGGPGFSGGYGFGGGYGNTGYGSQSSAGGMRPHGNGNGPGYAGGAGYNTGYAPGAGWGVTPNNTILPYPGLPPRGGAGGSMFNPQDQFQGQGFNGMTNAGMNNGAFNMGNVQANVYGNTYGSPYQPAYNLQ